ncbi:MAG: flagellar export chaperone FlgN [Magnetococcales bacterium]|nr:flagellar export chaperone FlgN [Magnetococcales bacterium]MBF0322525.1 flagellar export chaperone FlgN [Magnetococcales bacterium]
MKPDVAPLRDVLESLVLYFEQLHALLQKERELIRKREADRIYALSGEIGTLLATVRTVDAQRQEIIQGMAQALNIPAEGLDLSTLDRELGGQSNLLPLRDRLREAIYVADQTNKENQAAFKGVLNAMEAILKAMGEGNRAIFYNRIGGRQTTGSFHSRFSKQL